MKTHADIIQCSANEARELVKDWKGNGISGVINVAHNIQKYGPPIPYDPWLPVLHHPHKDEITPPWEWFQPILSFYDWARQHGKVLIHCWAGANRSTGTFGVLLVARHGLKPSQALAITGMPGYGAWRVAIEQAARQR